MPIEPIRRFKLSTVVAAQIEALVRSGEFSPGDRLPGERELSEEFGVSRSSTREALRILEASGVVTIVHGVGSFVSDGKKSEAASLLTFEGTTLPDLFDVRRAVESEAASLAAKRASAGDIAQLRQVVSAMHDETVEDAAYVGLDRDLHAGVVAATRNPFFVRFFDAIQEPFVAYSLRVIGLPARRERATVGHAAIVDAIANRRSGAARTAMAQHLRSAENDILTLLNNETKSPGRSKSES